MDKRRMQSTIPREPGAQRSLFIWLTLAFTAKQRDQSNTLMLGVAYKRKRGFPR